MSSRKNILAGLLGVLVFVGGAGAAMPVATETLASWVVDPAAPGDSIPPVGRSLFDQLFAVSRSGQATIDLPFPFDRLLARLDAQMASAPGSALPPTKRVLIPLGRSLQRTAAAPDFFAFPRVVVAADSPPASLSSHSSPLLKDRLYIGYQEKSAILEVISYNEAAGRFEFQLVKDYRAGGKPQVVYAKRTLCFACHQNGAPIFSRALWDETNANPQIAARLAASRAHFYGIPPQRGVDIPYAIDIAVKRANGFALTQRLWREACGDDSQQSRRCRAGLFVAALRHSISDGRKDASTPALDRESATTLRTEAARRWPNGLAIGVADIPNRNPLQASTGGEAIAVSAQHIPTVFDPLLPRPSRETWQLGDAGALDQLVGGLAEFVATTDRQRLADALAKRTVPLVRHHSTCRVEPGAARWSLRCQSGASGGGLQLTATIEKPVLERRRGQLERLTLPGSGVINAIALVASAETRGQELAFIADEKRPPRGADGNPLTRIVFRIAPDDPGAGEVVVEQRDEFPTVVRAVNDLAEGPNSAALFDAGPFPREQLFAALFARLGVSKPAPCCLAAERLPPPKLDDAADGASAESAVDFYPYCATCHRSADLFPPGFLHGNAVQVEAQLRQCAPRLYVRLATADSPPERRDKTPMPPESLLPAFGTDSVGWRASPVRAAMLAQVSTWLRAETGQTPDLTQLLAGGYEALRPCLTPSPTP